MYAFAGTLRAVRFDPVQLEVVSEPVPVVEQVMTTGDGGGRVQPLADGRARLCPWRGDGR